eukprot:1194917-Prorocentrum_minimum.AAC.7
MEDLKDCPPDREEIGRDTWTLSLFATILRIYEHCIGFAITTVHIDILPDIYLIDSPTIKVSACVGPVGPLGVLYAWHFFEIDLVGNTY